MLAKFHLKDEWVTTVVIVALLSFAVWPLAPLIGATDVPANAPNSYRTYFQIASWWGFPFIFLGMAPLLWLTWQPLLRAWEHLAESGVMLSPHGRPDEATVQRVLDAVRGYRHRIVFASIVIALGINTGDIAPRIGILLGYASFGEQASYACKFPDAHSKWIIEALAERAPDACAGVNEAASGQPIEKGISPPAGQLVFNTILAAQQFLIVFFAALAVSQILLHTWLFAGFERLPIARTNGLRLMLNCKSPINEFGLEQWNYALNNFYWAASPALLGVFLSRASTAPEDYLPGQQMLGIAVPACLIAPMAATIIVRQIRLPAIWKTIDPDGPVTPEDYRRQQLWPLDRNWSSKLGILLAFGLAALSIGFELTKLMRL